MRINSKLTSLALFACAVGACGYTSEGTGTETLRVVADMIYEVSDNELAMRVDVAKDGSPVDDAEVQVRDGEKDALLITLLFDPATEVYYGSADGYHRRLALIVDAGDDDNLEARLEGPGAHTIEQPVNAATLDRDELDPLHVRWGTEDGIRADIISAGVFGNEACTTTGNDDDGGEDVPCTTQLPGSARVGVARTNEVDLAGGTSGSRFRLTYQVANDVVVE